MDLYIQIINGQPVNHPAVAQNLIDAYVKIPEGWEPFKRITEPEANLTIGLYQKSQCTYVLGSDGKTWEDSWSVVSMTQDEITAKQENYKKLWLDMPDSSNFSAWTFNPETCNFDPPTHKPRGDYFWQGTTNSWVAIPSYPTDGKEYKLDILTATWVEVTT